MRARQAYRDREEVEVALLDALVDRGEEGMTVLELRAAVDADIEAIESGLEALKRDDLIAVESDRESTVIRPDERVVPSPDEEPPEPSFMEWLRDQLPF